MEPKKWVFPDGSYVCFDPQKGLTVSHKNHGYTLPIHGWVRAASMLTDAIKYQVTEDLKRLHK